MCSFMIRGSENSIRRAYYPVVRPGARSAKVSTTRCFQPSNRLPRRSLADCQLDYFSIGEYQFNNSPTVIQPVARASCHSLVRYLSSAPPCYSP